MTTWKRLLATDAQSDPQRPRRIQSFNPRLFGIWEANFRRVTLKNNPITPVTLHAPAIA